MSTSRPYPDHIYEQIRVEIAGLYLKRELRKLFPQLRGKEIWAKIDSSIDSWFPEDGNVIGVRDFWNGFHGIAMGFLLKNGFIQVLTAENVAWQYVDQLPLDHFLASGGDLKYIHDTLSEKRPRADRLRDFFRVSENSDLAKFWRNEFTKHGQSSEERDQFPIICVEEVDQDEKILSTYDGNRRMILAVLEGREFLPAYVGRYTTSDLVPKNFWQPTSFLMELVKEAELVGGEVNYGQTLALLRSLNGLSKSGQYELRERVLVGTNRFRNRLKKDLGIL